MLRYKVMNCTGIPEDHTPDLSFKDAEELRKELENDFPNDTYEVHPYEHIERKEKNYYSNPDQADGWEDLFNR